MWLTNHLATIIFTLFIVSSIDEKYSSPLLLSQETEINDQTSVLFNEANRLYQLKQSRDVLALVDGADPKEPGYAEFLNIVGISALACRELEKAEIFLREAIQVKSDVALYFNNLGAVLIHLKRLDEAEACYRQALTLMLEYPEAHHNLSLLLMSQGRLKEGLQRYEQRYHPALGNPNSVAPFHLPFPQWRGQSLQGKSILLWPEQGYGDKIQFCCYCAELKRLGASRITLVCDGLVMPLLKTLSDVDAVVFKEEVDSLQTHDYWSLLLSLPLHCGTTLENIPADLPYLHASIERIARYLPLLPASGLKVGLVWKGASGHPNYNNRSLPHLSMLAPLWLIAGISFISLQKGQAEDEAVALMEGQPILALGKHIQDFADTAAIVSQLDLVICVDTSIAHLAGAMNKSCWVLLSAIQTDWRWFQESSDTPWYPEVMRLFRQKVDGNWAAVISDVVLALADWQRETHKLRILSPTNLEHYQWAEEVFASFTAQEIKTAKTDPSLESGKNTLSESFLPSSQKSPVNALIQEMNGLYLQGRFNEALALAEEAESREGGNADFLNAAAICAISAGEHELAESLLRRALDIKPDVPEAYNNLGLVLTELKYFNEAETCYRQALFLKSDYAYGYNNLGELFRKLMRYDEAESCFRQALTINLDYPEAHQNLSMLLNTLGRFTEGWQRHEQRYHPALTSMNTAAPFHLPFPQWRGQPLQGKSILLWPEQGHGDQIQFCRYCAELEAVRRGLDHTDLRWLSQGFVQNFGRCRCGAWQG